MCCCIIRLTGFGGKVTRSETLAILRFLEETRSPGLRILGVEARDPVWMMTIALLRRHYMHKRITISSLAHSSGTSYTTALRRVDRMVNSGLLRRVRKQDEAKFVYMEPTEDLLRNFQEYCQILKSRMGEVFGLGRSSTPEFVFGAAHLAARILAQPLPPATPLGLEPPLRILLSDEPTFLVLDRLAAEISVILDTEIETTVLEYEPLNQRVIENSKASCSDFDLIALDIPWLGRMAMEQALQPMDDWLRDGRTNPFDFYATAWESARCQGQQLGLPFAATAELFLYRKDMFAEHHLPPPTTVNLVLAAAKKIHDPIAGRFGIAWNAARGQPLGQTFIQVMASFGSPPVSLNHLGAGYDLDTPWNELRPTIDSDAGRETLEYLRELAEYSPPNISEMDWSARMEAYRSGLVAMCYEWSTRTLNFEDDLESPARSNTGYLSHPSRTGGLGISPMGGWVLAIPSNVGTARKQPVWRALQWLTSPEFTKCLIQNGSPAKFRHSVSSDPEVSDMVPVFGTVDAMEKRGQLQIWPRPPVPFMTSMMRIVGQEVHDAIWGQAPAANVLHRAECRLESMFASIH